VDLRIIAATKPDLLEEARAGRFREDLAYRLNVAELRLPPLRERREDIPLLFDHFARNAAERLGRSVAPLSGAQLAHLLSHDWPGNVRELANVAERQVLGLASLNRKASKPASPGRAAGSLRGPVPARRR
jgi:two-component system C4-dicarboxylate transport response regulator DctD